MLSLSGSTFGSSQSIYNKVITHPTGEEAEQVEQAHQPNVAPTSHAGRIYIYCRVLGKWGLQRNCYPRGGQDQALKTGIPIEEGDSLLKLPRRVSHPEIQLGVVFYSELDFITSPFFSECTLPFSPLKGGLLGSVHLLSEGGRWVETFENSKFFRTTPSLEPKKYVDPPLTVRKFS